MFRFPQAILAALSAPHPASRRLAALPRRPADDRRRHRASSPSTLDEQWTFKTGDGKRTAGSRRAAIVGGIVYVASFDKHLYALDLATGKKKWKTKLGPHQGIAGRQGRPRLRRRPGRQVLLRRRRRREECSGRSRPAARSRPRANFHGDNVLFGSHDSTPLLPQSRRARRSGTSRSTARSTARPRSSATGHSSPASDSILHVIDATNGKELGSIDLGGQRRDGRRRRATASTSAR